MAEIRKHPRQPDSPPIYAAIQQVGAEMRISPGYIAPDRYARFAAAVFERAKNIRKLFYWYKQPRAGERIMRLPKKHTYPRITEEKVKLSLRAKGYGLESPEAEVEKMIAEAMVQRVGPYRIPFPESAREQIEKNIREAFEKRTGITLRPKIIHEAPPQIVTKRAIAPGRLPILEPPSVLPAFPATRLPDFPPSRFLGFGLLR